MSVKIETDVAVVLFDGYCNLCNTSVDFIVRHENGNELKFASLQSEIGKSLVDKSNLREVPDSILFYQNGKLYTKSKAVLRVCRHLSFPLNLLLALGVIPVRIADSLYDWVARNRYRWFGTKVSCRVPTEEERNKFLT